MTKPNELKLRRIALEIKESEVIQTGRDLASLVLAIPHGIDSRTRAQARLFLRRHKATQKTRLLLTIEEVNNAAETVDRMIPDAEGSPARGAGTSEQGRGEP